jgi:DNA-binding LacI/PurR family transcriptional regulator
MYRDPLEDKLDRVIVDSLDYSYRCTKMLIEQGAEKIALVNGPSYQLFSDATQGYMKALTEADRKFDERLVLNCAEDDAVFVEQKFTEWLEKQDIDAVFASGENLQIGVRQGLWNFRRSDIMLASVTYGALKSSPNCLLLKISPDKIASEAIELIGKRLANSKKTAETIKISAK